MKLKLLLTAASLFWVSTVHSTHAQSLDKIFRKFSQCDASFFKQMMDEAHTVRTLATTESKDDSLWFKVAKRSEEDTGTVMLAKKPTIAQLNVASYVDYVMNLKESGLYYTWGFKVRGEYATVVNALTPLVFENARLHKDDSIYVRTELKIGASAWLPMTVAGGTVPKAGTVERAFLIEPDEKDTGLVMVTCNLQGSVEAEHLKELRPDIDDRDYPKKPEFVTFESVNVDPELLGKLQTALKEQPLFMPKFKKAVVNYKTVFEGREFEETDTLIHITDGVSEVLEETRSTKLRRQTIGGFLLTKVGYYYDPKSELAINARIAKNGTVEFAKKLVKDEVAFQSTVTYKQIPTSMGKESTVRRFCITGETIAAADVFSELPGRAILFKCGFDGKVDNVGGYALIEDYGLVLRYELPATERLFKTIYISIAVERDR